MCHFAGTTDFVGTRRIGYAETGFHAPQSFTCGPRVAPSPDQTHRHKHRDHIQFRVIPIRREDNGRPVCNYIQHEHKRTIRARLMRTKSSVWQLYLFDLRKNLPAWLRAQCISNLIFPCPPTYLQGWVSGTLTRCQTWAAPARPDAVILKLAGMTVFLEASPTPAACR